MGLTGSSTGRGAAQRPQTEIRREGRTLIALAGNPNVGKSTVFNALTGLHQHTGNWAGKTVGSAVGLCKSGEREYIVEDIPGTYSLKARSAEEELARDRICFGGAEAVVLVCDAGCLERNMNLVLQTMETGVRVLLCVNLMDEARRRGMEPDLKELERRLGVPVLPLCARKRGSREAVLEALDRLMEGESAVESFRPEYPEAIERAVEALLPETRAAGGLDGRWLCLRLLENDEAAARRAEQLTDSRTWAALSAAAESRRRQLEQAGIGRQEMEDMTATALVRAGEELCRGIVRTSGRRADADRKIDRVVTSRLFGYPIMLALLALIFYITLVGANYPSALLSRLLFSLEPLLYEGLRGLGAPLWLAGMAAEGAYRVLAWVTAVMLPPMAIFFPLFTLLEDLGYLPRAAYNLDAPFRRCKACGKQALTMCMGFGCNAAGVVGCRIIDSRRERLLAVLTNSFVPCNGRFPMLISLISIFFVGSAGQGAAAQIYAAALLTGLIALSVVMSLGATWLLSHSLLRGEPSPFTLELPPYRLPQVGRVLLRSVLDRTLFVLGRAAAVAAPAGALLWLAANVQPGGVSLLARGAALLEGPGRFLGMDGVILMAFILGFPANETVLPIIIMAYTASGSLSAIEGLGQLQSLLAANGWGRGTALCVMLFSMLHWPCSTTLLTVKKETGSALWTAVAAALPTAAGVLVCAAAAAALRAL